MYWHLWLRDIGGGDGEGGQTDDDAGCYYCVGIDGDLSIDDDRDGHLCIYCIVDGLDSLSLCVLYDLGIVMFLWSLASCPR